MSQTADRLLSEAQAPAVPKMPDDDGLLDKWVEWVLITAMATGPDKDKLAAAAHGIKLMAVRQKQPVAFGEGFE